jgi:hypothetical protein
VADGRGGVVSPHGNTRCNVLLCGLRWIKYLRQLRLNNAIDLYKALGGGMNENTVSVAAKQ